MIQVGRLRLQLEIFRHKLNRLQYAVSLSALVNAGHIANDHRVLRVARTASNVAFNVRAIGRYLTYPKPSVFSFKTGSGIDYENDCSLWFAVDAPEFPVIEFHQPRVVATLRAGTTSGSVRSVQLTVSLLSV